MRKIVLSFIFLLGIFLSLNLFAQNENMENSDVSIAELWQKSLEELRSNLAILLEENQELRQKQDSLNNRIAELESLLKKSEVEKEGLSSSLMKSGEELSKARNEAEGLRNEKILLEKKLAEVEKNKVASLTNEKEAELDNSQKQIQSLKAELSKKNAEINRLEKIIKENAPDKSLSDKLRNKELEIETKEAVISKISQEKQRLENESLDLKKEIARLRKSPVNAEKKIKSLQDQARDLISEKEALERENSSLKKDLAAKFKIIEDLNKEREESVREKAISDSLLKLRSQEEEVSPPASQAKVSVNYEVRGYNFARQGMLTEAIEEYKKAIKQNPQNKDLYYNLAYLYSRLDILDEAIENYNKALELDPKDKESLYNLSKIYEKLQDEKKTKYYYGAYLKLEKK